MSIITWLSSLSILTSSLLRINFFWKSKFLSSLMCSENLWSGLKKKIYSATLGRTMEAICFFVLQSFTNCPRTSINFLLCSTNCPPTSIHYHLSSTHCLLTYTILSLTCVCCQSCWWWRPCQSGLRCGPCQSRPLHGAAACGGTMSSGGTSCTGYWMGKEKMTP